MRGVQNSVQFTISFYLNSALSSRLNYLDSSRLAGFLKSESDTTWLLILYTRYLKHPDKINQLFSLSMTCFSNGNGMNNMHCSIAETVINYYSVKLKDRI